MPDTTEQVGVRLILNGKTAFVSGLNESGHAVESLESKSKKADKTMQSWSSKGLSAISTGLGKLWGLAKTAATWIGGLGAGALAGALAIGYKQAAKMQVVLAQTNATLASTHGVSGMTASSITHLADSLSGMSGKLNTSIIQAENLLLIFPEIRNQVGKGNNIFDQATLAALNMSQALGKDLPTAANMLGRALQNPVQGMMALRRAGVVFTTAQQSQIKSLVMSGQLLTAQKVILDQLNLRFGNSAKMYGQTLPGAIARFRVVGVEALGTLVQSGLSLVAGPLARIDDWMTRMNDQMPKLAARARTWLSATAGRMGGFMSDVRSGVLTSNTDIASGFLGALGLSGPMMDRLTPILARLIMAGKDLFSIVRALTPTVRWFLSTAIAAALPMILALSNAVHFLAQHGSALQPIIVALAVGFGGFVILTKINAAVKAATEAWAAFNLVLDANPIGLTIVAVAALAAGLIYAYQHCQTFRDLVNGVFRDVKQWALDAAHWVASAWNAVWAWFAKLPGRIGRSAEGMWDGMANAFIDAINVVIRTWNWFMTKMPLNVVEKGFGIGKGDVGVVGTLSHVGGPPKAHEGASILGGGSVIIRPDEEMVTLPPAATVEPVPSGRRMSQAAPADDGRPLVVQLVLDRKVLAETTVKGMRSLAARK